MSQSLPVEAQVAAVRQLVEENPELTLEAIAEQHPHLAQGIEELRKASMATAGSESGPLERTPISQL